MSSKENMPAASTHVESPPRGNSANTTAEHTYGIAPNMYFDLSKGLRPETLEQKLETEETARDIGGTVLAKTVESDDFSDSNKAPKESMANANKDESPEDIKDTVDGLRKSHDESTPSTEGGGGGEKPPDPPEAPPSPEDDETEEREPAFAKDQPLRVKRTAGNIEDDWFAGGEYTIGGTVYVNVRKRDGVDKYGAPIYIEKGVPLEELRQWQNEPEENTGETHPTDSTTESENAGAEDEPFPETPESGAGEGGGDKPPEPPEAPPGPDEPDEDPEEDVIEHDNRLRNSELDALYIEAKQAHLHFETVLKALSDGFENPIAYLVRSRRSPEMVEHLKTWGYDMSPPEINVEPPLRNPIDIGYEKGDIRRASKQELAKMMRDSLAADYRPGDVVEVLEAVRERTGPLARVPILRRLIGPAQRSEIDRIRDVVLRPHEIVQRPFFEGGAIYQIPYIGRRMAIRYLARQIFEEEKRHRDPNSSYNDGSSGQGTGRLDEIRRALNKMDERIRVDRSKLSGLNRHNLRGESDTPRLRLAESLKRDFEEVERLIPIYDSEGKMVKGPTLSNPEDPLYPEWKKQRKAYAASRNEKQIASDRNEFIRLRLLGARTSEQQKRFEELGGALGRLRDRYIYLSELPERTQEQQEELESLKGTYPTWYNGNPDWRRDV